MKKFWAFLFLALPVYSQDVFQLPQPEPVINLDDDGFIDFEWNAIEGRTYFIQYSHDLLSWDYLDDIIKTESGSAALTFVPTSQPVFWRLRFSDIPCSVPAEADFNGDGKTNRQNLNDGEDPLEKEEEEPIDYPAIVAAHNPNAPIDPNMEGPPLIEGHEYTLKVVHSGALTGNKTEEYLFDEKYKFLGRLTTPLGGSPGTVEALASALPVSLRRTPAGVSTAVTFQARGSRKHNRFMDVVFYVTDQGEDNPYEEVLSFRDIDPFIVLKEQRESATQIYPGDNADNALYWSIAPMVVRGTDESVTPHVVGSHRAGVDNLSRLAAPTNVGFQSHTWIMAPIAQGANSVQIEMNPPHALKLVPTMSTVTPDLFEQPKVNTAWSAAAGSAEAEEVLVVAFKNELNKTLASQVKIKSMKYREITVNVYPIVSKGRTLPGGETRADMPPNPVVSAAKLQEEFDAIYLNQVNLKCNIVMHDNKVVDWDFSSEGDYFNPFSIGFGDKPVPGDKKLYTKFGVAPEVERIKSAYTLAAVELHIFWVGGATGIINLHNVDGKLTPSGEFGLGVAELDDNYCFVAGNIKEFYNPTTPEALNGVKQGLRHTMLHEIGHLVIGGGHPDQFDPSSNDVPNQTGGVAPLANDRSLHVHRLMRSGNIREGLGRSMVKAEWDKIIENLDRILATGAGGGDE